jgi:hypothetical protein
MLLSRAVRIGHSDIVQVLLDDGRADPSEGDNRMIRDAVRSGDIDTIRVLLSDERVDPTVDHLSILRESIRCGYADILRLLLRDRRVIRALMKEDIYPDVLEAVAASRIEALKIIFDREYVIPDLGLFITAARMSSLDMMGLLLAQDEAPGVSREAILRAARIRKRDDMIELLTHAASRVLR